MGHRMTDGRRWVRAAGVGLLSAGFVAVVLSFLADGRSAGPVWTLLPDCGGPIRRVLLVVNSARRSSLRNAALVSRIVNALPRRVKVLIATSDPAAFTIAGEVQAERVRLVPLPESLNLTIWPQDPMLVLTGADGRNCLLLPREFKRADDRKLGIAIAGIMGWTYRDSDLWFEGGNVLSDERHVFIGADTIAENATKLPAERGAVVRRFRRELGRDVLVIGPSPQVVGHIDMMLTPLGAGRIVVADAGWGVRIAERELADRPKTVRAFERNCRGMFFGNPAIRKLSLPGGRTVEPPELVGWTDRAVRDTRLIAPVLDGIARSLARQGYHVIRVPFLYVLPLPPQSHDGRAGQGASTGAVASQPGWAETLLQYPTLTYNNVLIETFDGRSVVYLPQYGWEAMDSAARAAWGDAGFQVRPVDGFAISAIYGGSLRCCTKVLSRE